LSNIFRLLPGRSYDGKHTGTWDIIGIAPVLHWNYSGVALKLHRRCTVIAINVDAPLCLAVLLTIG